MTEQPVCTICGEVIGMYEPVVAVTEESTRQTSLAHEPGLAEGRPLLVDTSARHRWNPSSGRGNSPSKSRVPLAIADESDRSVGG
jgi:hypothetical protein